MGAPTIIVIDQALLEHLIADFWPLALLAAGAFAVRRAAALMKEHKTLENWLASPQCAALQAWLKANRWIDPKAERWRRKDPS